MNVTGALLIGLAVGVALGIGGAVVFRGDSAPAPPLQEVGKDSHEACEAREAALLVELEALRSERRFETLVASEG